MPNALDLLRQDHDHVKDLFKQFERARDSSAKKKIVSEALHELEVHAILEEELVYPEIRAIGGIDHMMDEAAEEHHVATLLIEELKGMTPRDEHFDAKFMVLAENVRHHIEEEESDMLPKGEELGGGRLEELGRMMMERKEQLQEAVPAGAQGDGASNLEEMTKTELGERARQAGIRGRSNMSKDELIDALRNR